MVLAPYGLCAEFAYTTAVCINFDELAVQSALEHS